MENKRIELEYVLNSTQKNLFYSISMPAGLSSWFADRVDRVGDSLNFFWRNHSEIADIIATDDSTFVRYQWEKDRGSERFFEIRIIQSEITKGVTIHIITVVDMEEDDSELLWNNAISKLKLVQGMR